MRNAKKYLIILLFTLLTLCCTAGASTWIITETVNSVPQWEEGKKAIYLRTDIEFGYDQHAGGVSLVKDVLPELFVDEGGQKIIFEGDANASITSVSDGLSTWSGQNNIGNITVGNTYQLKVALNNAGTYTVAGTYDGGTIHPIEQGEELNVTNTPVLLKYKTVQIGTGQITGEQSGLLATSKQTLKLSFTPQTIDGAAWFTIEDALAKAKNQVIRVVGSTTETTSTNDAVVTSFTKLGSNFTNYSTNNKINSGVTLFLPYNGNDGVNDEMETTNGKVLNNDNYKKCELIIPQGITLVNEGKIIIGGMTTGVQNATNGIGHTASLYAQIVLGENAKIDSSGEIISWGFIKEQRQNNNSSVNMLQSGKLSMPFWICEHRGGSNLSSMAGSPQGAPFNRYILENVTPKLTAVSGAIVLGNAYILINTLSRHVRSEVNFVGNTTDYFVQLKSGASMEWKYSIDECSIGVGADAVRMAAQTVKFDLYGDIQINPLSVAVQGATISTQNAGIPIPWQFYISFHVAEGTTTATVNSHNQDIKILPGGTIKIEEGVTLQIKQLIVHDHTLSVPAAGAAAYNNGNPNQIDGVFVVNGTVEADKLGGYVQTKVDNAQLKVGTNTATSSEFNGSEGGIGGMGARATWVETTKTLTGNTYRNGTIQSSELAAGIYSSKIYGGDGTWWTAAKYAVKYHLEGGNVDGNTGDVERSFDGLLGEEYSSSDWLTATAPAPSAVKQYYTLDGWKLADGTQVINKDGTVANDVTVTGGATLELYAIWTPTVYNINYESIFPDGMSGTADYSSLPKSFTVESTQELSFDDITVDNNFAFVAVYTDRSCTAEYQLTLDSSFTLSKLVDYLNGDNTVTLYVQWRDNATKQFSITYHNSTVTTIPGYETVGETTVTVLETDTYELLKPVEKDDIAYSHIFLGWFLTKDGDEIGITSFEQLKDVCGDETNIVLDAHWEAKTHVTISGEHTDSSLDGYYKEREVVDLSEMYGLVTADDYDVIVRTYFGGWSVEGGTGTLAGNQYTVGANGETVTITAQRTNKVILTVNVSGKSAITLTAEGVSSGLPNNTTVNTQYYLKPGTKVTYTIAFNVTTTSGVSQSVDPSWDWEITVNGQKTDGNAGNTNYSETIEGSFKMPDSGNASVTASGTNGSTCIVEGTLIMMADGTQKKVEDLQIGDMVLVFNHETGRYESSKLRFNTHAELERGWYRIINLVFSDGTTLRIYNNHGLFDHDLLQYVFIDESNMHDFIGHRFSKTELMGDTWIDETVALTSAFITKEYVKVFGPSSEYHVNLVAEGLLTVSPLPGGLKGHVNVFEYDETMQYNQEAMQRDIERYGLLTYDEVKDYMSYEDYTKAGTQYLKVAIGKGLITWEELEAFIRWLELNGMLS